MNRQPTGDGIARPIPVRAQNVPAQQSFRPIGIQNSLYNRIRVCDVCKSPNHDKNQCPMTQLQNIQISDIRDSQENNPVNLGGVTYLTDSELSDEFSVENQSVGDTSDSDGEFVLYAVEEEDEEVQEEEESKVEVEMEEEEQDDGSNHPQQSEVVVLRGHALLVRWKFAPL